ncbi:type IV secretion protein Rhs [Streptomyces sp. CB02923]|uniref:putative T7SS-secreted protein n=1 Tax=Streptomyces sp. CB02923 TaxID=1718985 RepID=UPI00093BBFD5|nr:DUF6531 domain-containing protein [Streptomyces sp. CB02923]OKI00210.1 type IV secretion protein Rhs [Streptomyces sp. CB02923]
MGVGDVISGLGNALDSAADKAGDLIDGAKEKVGEGVEFVTDKTADALDSVGAEGVADSVRSAGEDVADSLGAHVDERNLGESDDPKALIHGDASAINESASHLKDFSAAFERVGQGLRKLDSGGWEGKAADSFHEEFDAHPKQWMQAADACEAAGKALHAYGETVSWAQGKAQTAIDKYKAAQDVTKKAVDTYQSQVDTYNAKADAYNAALEKNADPGQKPQKPGAFSDPGAEGRKAAQELLKNARHQRDEAAERAQHAITQALAHAPREPKFTEQLLSDVSDGAVSGGIQLLHFAGGALRAGTETVKLVRTVNPLDIYNITHPFQYMSNLSTTLMGLTTTVAHPERLPKALLGTGWGSDPADAAGSMIVNLVGGKGAGGLAKGAAKAGAKGLAKDTARSAVKDGGKSALRDRARRAWCKTFGSDPIDMATGRMVLPQTDITLPGSFPLTFARTFESSYRTGRWFGPTWMSTVDQRLEIDAEGVVLIGEEGTLLAYPHPAVGVPTLPVEGEGLPLERTPDGDYFLTDPAGGTRWYFTTYTDDIAVLDEISDRRGNRHTFDYDETGTPTAITHSAGHRLLFTTEAGRITALHLAGAAPGGGDQLIRRYGYDESGNLATITHSHTHAHAHTHATGRPLRFTYDAADRITSWTDTNNSSYSYVYDDRHRCIWQSGTEGHLRAHFTWGDPDPDTGLRTNLHHNSHDQVTRHLVNDRHQIVATTDPSGATTRTVRDAKHRVLSVTDPLGRSTHIAYDDGRPTQVTLPDGSRTTSTYDDRGLPLTTTGPDGTTWTHTYDLGGNRTSTTDPSGATTRYAYDARGHLSAVTDALGNTTRLYCDEAGLPLSTTDPLGARTHYRRDAFGRITSVTDPLGETTHLVWTVEGQLATRIDPTGAAEHWSYDGEGNRTSHTDALGQVTSFEYTHFDLLAARTDPDGTRHTFTHDTELRLTQVTNPQGLTWNYAYDAAGRLTSETDFDDRVLAYTHDASGQLAGRTDALGQVTTYTHTALGDLAEKNAAGLTTTYAYDTAGRLLRTANPDAAITYTRDALGRVTTETVNGRTLSFTYDALGRRTSRTTPTGATATYTYDAAGNRTHLSASGHPLAFDHDAAGRETTRHLSDALTLTQSWDPTGRLTSQSLTPTPPNSPSPSPSSSSPSSPSPSSPLSPSSLLSRTYTYRPDGNLTGIDDSTRGRRTFDLDRAGRVTSVNAANWTETYAYDDSGNQTHATWPSEHAGTAAQGPRTYTGTRINRAGSIRYEHDALGRVTLRQKTRLSRKPDTWHYTWNAEDRLTAVVTPDGALWHYTYDPLGRRTAKHRLSPDGTTPLESTHFTWDGPTLTEQSTTTPTTPTSLTLTWTHDGLTPLTQSERKLTTATPQHAIDERFFNIVTDLVGTPTELISESGEIAWQSHPTLWGTTTWNRNATAYTPLRFPGQYFDPETQLHYNVQRHYDSSTGRYLSADPLGLEPSDNPVSYVGNPATWCDPLGLSPCTADVNPRKLDYLFNKNVKPDPHNTPRAKQNAEQLRSIGFHDTPASRQFVTDHLKNATRNGFSETFTNQWGNFGKTHSVIYGPHGIRSAESSWQILDDGSLRLSTVIFSGGGRASYYG